jgi:hypothetical protein
MGCPPSILVTTLLGRIVPDGRTFTKIFSESESDVYCHRQSNSPLDTL